jgi:hypothetical protein
MKVNHFLHRDNFWIVMSHLGFLFLIILFFSSQNQIQRLESQNHDLILENRILKQKEKMFYINQENQNR